MMIKSSEEIVIYESPDGGKTVYTRKSGEAVRHLHAVNEAWQKEQESNVRWANLKSAVFMADSVPALDDAIKKVEMLYLLLKDEQK
jgi:hypothetical protein